MEAFVSCSPFHGTAVLAANRVQTSPRIRPLRHVTCAKKSSRPGKNTKKTPKKSSSSPSSPFAGMAAGPGSPSKSLSSKPQTSGENEENGGINPSTEKEEGNASTLRAVRALGQKKPQKPPEFRAKTAADFIAEGVEDDVETFPLFQENDIRFGVADLADPFKQDADADEAARKQTEEENEKKNIGKSTDVTGDGGVLKKLITPGEGEVAPAGAKITVEYTGKLQDGTVFDTSRKRKGGFSFELGAGQVIKGWEAGVATMRKGEVAEFEILPSYGYGRRGMPPVIPGNATLTFEIELIEFEGGAQEEEVKKMSDFNVDVPRDPEQIALDYDARLKTREERRKKMSFFDRFYIISPFASQTGERPPWWLNPRITFVAIALFCAAGFYLVIKSGAFHVGYVDEPVDVNIFK